LDTCARFILLGKLVFDDFGLLDPITVRRVCTDLPTQKILGKALNNAPNILLHFIHSCPDLEKNLVELADTRCSDPAETCKAKQELVHSFAFELLREKAPALYDALPWHDWDFSIVTDKFRLWRTKLLLCGEGTTVTIEKCRRTAGVYVLEPVEIIARYLEKKGGLEKVKRLKVLRSSSENIPLGPNSVELAIADSVGENPDKAFKELARVSSNILVLCTRPEGLCPPVKWFCEHGFTQDSVRVNPTGAALPCWWFSKSLD